VPLSSNQSAKDSGHYRAAAWPLAARGQQAGLPVVGIFHGGAFEPRAHLVAVFRQTLSEAAATSGLRSTDG